VPDFYLVGKGFEDDSKQQRYVPADYPDHGDGLIFVGVEETGKIHVVALNHQDGSAALVATIATPNPGVMASNSIAKPVTCGSTATTPAATNPGCSTST